MKDGGSDRWYCVQGGVGVTGGFDARRWRRVYAVCMCTRCCDGNTLVARGLFLCRRWRIVLIAMQSKVCDVARAGGREKEGGMPLEIWL